jgi:hypothetical protein
MIFATMFTLILLYLKPFTKVFYSGMKEQPNIYLTDQSPKRMSSNIHNNRFYFTINQYFKSSGNYVFKTCFNNT